MTPKQHNSFAPMSGAADLKLGMVWTAAVLGVAVAATLALRTTVSFDALAPAVATVLFGLAALVAVVGLLSRRYGFQIDIADVAGILTFIGVGVSVAIEPDQLVGLLTWPNRTD